VGRGAQAPGRRYYYLQQVLISRSSLLLLRGCADVPAVEWKWNSCLCWFATACCRDAVAQRHRRLHRLQLVQAGHEDQRQDHPRQVPCCSPHHLHLHSLPACLLQYW
jgi:hypothetical protein